MGEGGREGGREGEKQAGGRGGGSWNAAVLIHPSINPSTNGPYHILTAETHAGMPQQIQILAAMHPTHALKPSNQHTHAPMRIPLITLQVAVGALESCRCLPQPMQCIVCTQTSNPHTPLPPLLSPPHRQLLEHPTIPRTVAALPYPCTHPFNPHSPLPSLLTTPQASCWSASPS